MSIFVLSHFLFTELETNHSDPCRVLIYNILLHAQIFFTLYRFVYCRFNYDLCRRTAARSTNSCRLQYTKNQLHVGVNFEAFKLIPVLCFHYETKAQLIPNKFSCLFVVIEYAEFSEKYVLFIWIFAIYCRLL
jgi:hypothetical protein